MRSGTKQNLAVSQHSQFLVSNSSVVFIHIGQVQIESNNCFKALRASFLRDVDFQWTFIGITAALNFGKLVHRISHIYNLC